MVTTKTRTCWLLCPCNYLPLRRLPVSYLWPVQPRHVPRVGGSRCKGWEGQVSLRAPSVPRPRLRGSRQSGAGGCGAEPLLALFLAALREPGGGEQWLRNRHLPEGPGSGYARARCGRVEFRPEWE